MMTEFEAGVRELVARLRDFERRMKKVEDDAGALEQFVKLITPGLGFGAAGSPTFPSCGCDVPEVIIATDSVLGDFTLTYDPANAWWTGCRVISLASYTYNNLGSFTCPAVNSAMRWTLKASNCRVWNSFALTNAPGDSGSARCAVANSCASSLVDNTGAWLGSYTTSCGPPFSLTTNSLFVNVSQFYRGATPSVHLHV